MPFSKAMASMMIEIPLAEHNRIHDFLPFGLCLPRFLTNAVTLDPFLKNWPKLFLEYVPIMAIVA
jgi:hypothetical protein